MIYDSQTWKRELVKLMRRLRIYSCIKWTDRRFGKYAYKIDLVLLTSAIVIRKLIESDKLSDEADNYQLKVIAYTPRRQIDKLHRWVEDGDYEWGDRKEEVVSAKTICNSLIHSYAYCPRFSEKFMFDGFMVTSDFDRNKLIYDIELTDWIKYMDYIASDSIGTLSLHYNEQKHDYMPTVKRRENF